MFEDRNPAAAEHYLVITKEHIRESQALPPSFSLRQFLTASICSLDRSRVDVGELLGPDAFHHH